MESEQTNRFPSLDRLEQAAKDTFWDYLGCQIDELNDKQVTISVDIKPHHLNLIGILHGGVHASVVDSAMGLLVMLARPEVNVVTIHLNMNYVAPTGEGKVIVTAELIHSTRKLITAQAYARKENGDLLAFGTGTFRVLEKSISNDLSKGGSPDGHKG
ncbi:PaaI family thioesterase [Paenibacillus pini]|uniref:Phenylacetic acid degradation protein paaI n=1 Tax=Paenibacillus pini JCM 16418 TaxID=1236976 RepID=W7YII2_9BACL|nr:PaaI family thioesterase [Paenibacillus pini]GAF07428.1 phenylacetic acid degradation protein paaI [Paenibacillus pini JCM 16418]